MWQELHDVSNSQDRYPVFSTETDPSRYRYHVYMISAVFIVSLIERPNDVDSYLMKHQTASNSQVRRHLAVYDCSTVS